MRKKTSRTRVLCFITLTTYMFFVIGVLDQGLTFSDMVLVPMVAWSFTLWLLDGRVGGREGY